MGNVTNVTSTYACYESSTTTTAAATTDTGHGDTSERSTTSYTMTTPDTDASGRRLVASPWTLSTAAATSSTTATS